MITSVTIKASVNTGTLKAQLPALSQRLLSLG